MAGSAPWIVFGGFLSLALAGCLPYLERGARDGRETEWSEDDPEWGEECGDDDWYEASEPDGMSFYMDLILLDRDLAEIEVESVDPVQGAVHVEYTVAVWGAESFDCWIVYALEGIAEPGGGPFRGGCDQCAGLVRFDPSTLLDLSGSTRCEPGLIEEAGIDQLVVPREDGGYGDFLELGLLAAQDMAELGLSADAAGTRTADALAADLASGDLSFSYAGVTRLAPGSFAEQAEVDQLASDAGPDGQWVFSWYTADTGLELEGGGRHLIGGSFWHHDL